MKRNTDVGLASLPFDEDGKISGFQFGGRQRAIYEWKEKKEQKEFDRLIKQLTDKRYKERRYSTPEAIEEKRRYFREYVRRRYAIDEEFRNKLRKVAKKRETAKAPVRTCVECGAQWMNLRCVKRASDMGKPRTKYCSKRCMRRFRSRAYRCEVELGIRKSNSRL